MTSVSFLPFVTILINFIIYYNIENPDIDILDEVCSYVSLKESSDLKKYNCCNKKLQNVLREKNTAIANGEYIYKNPMKRIKTTKWGASRLPVFILPKV